MVMRIGHMLLMSNVCCLKLTFGVWINWKTERRRPDDCKPEIMVSNSKMHRWYTYALRQAAANTCSIDM